MTQRVVTHIQTTNLSKTFNNTPAFERVSLTIRSGRTLVIAGPNGGGKTTLIDCLSGLIDADRPSSLHRPTNGHASAIDIRRSIGYVPDEDDTIGYLTALEYCQLVAAAYKKPLARTVAAAKDILRRLDFDQSKLNTLVVNFSHGMKKKLQLAAILAVSPPIIIIDEPTNGLDPTATLLLKKLLKDSMFSNSAFVIATHNLPFAQSVAGELLLLQQRPLAYGICNELLKDHATESLESLYEKLVTITIS